MPHQEEEAKEESVLFVAMADPRDFFAQHPQGTRYAIPWTLWYVSNGKDGQEPPESQKQRMKLFNEAIAGFYRSTAAVAAKRAGT